ncbi:MAG: hypothetical protein ACKVTZ_05680, partial [Bacteroidia bacterium]
MKAQHFLVVLLLWLLSLPLFAQSSSQKYWVFFRDKSIQNQHLALSPDALWNRYQQNISIDAKDYPVNIEYLKILQGLNIQPITTSRWLNGVSAYLNPQQISLLQQLPFVKDISSVAALSIAKTSEEFRTLDSLDYPKWQLDMLNLSHLHRLCFTGKGVKLAMMDNGFLVADTVPALRKIFEEGRILDTYDFVDKDSKVFDACFAAGFCRHGLNCFSIIGGK